MLECWSVGVLECLRVLECWSVVVLECWSVVVLECPSFQQCRSVGTVGVSESNGVSTHLGVSDMSNTPTLGTLGVSECRSVGVSECRSVGVLECWSVGVLEC